MGQPEHEGQVVREVLGQFELTTITFELSGNGEERTITVTP
jgi:hypothetical protein